MNDNFRNTDILIQYLDGELEGNELRAIQEKIASDNQLAKELESLRLAKESVKIYGLKMKIGAVHTEMMKELGTAAAPRSIGIRRILQYSTRIAAMLLIVLGITVLYQYFSATPEQLYRNSYETFRMHETRSVSGASLLEEPYKKGDPAAVTAFFNTLKDPQPEDYFLNGNAALEMNKPAAAIRSFLALTEKNKLNSTHFFEADAEYYLALAYLHNNEPAKALPIFEKIHADESHPYHRKVSTWFMRKLQRLGK